MKRIKLRKEWQSFDNYNTNLILISYIFQRNNGHNLFFNEKDFSKKEVNWATKNNNYLSMSYIYICIWNKNRFSIARKKWIQCMCDVFLIPLSHLQFFYRKNDVFIQQCNQYIAKIIAYSFSMLMMVLSKSKIGEQMEF